MTEINNNSNYDKKYEQMEILIHKLQIENITKNNEILKLRQEMKYFKKNIKDTASNFPLPYEFKSRWESLIKTSVMDILENSSYNSILLMRVINIIIKYVYEISIIKIRQKVLELLKCLGIYDNREENINNFFDKFQKLIFQDYFNTIFAINKTEFGKELISNIKNKILIKEGKLFSEIDKENILKDLNCPNINKFIIELFYLCLYMNINEPQLIIKTSTEIKYKYFNKKKYSNIEGFSKENDICLLLLNPPMTKNNINYKEIKPIVCLIDSPTEDIKNLCYQQNYKDTKNIIKYNSRSFSKSSNYIEYFKYNNKINQTQLSLKKNDNNYSSKSFIKINSSCNSYIFDNKNSIIHGKEIKKFNDDFNYKYKYDFEKILNNNIFERKKRSYKSASLNSNRNKFKKIYEGVKLSKTNFILNNINNLKQNQTRNINFLTFHKSHNIPKNYHTVTKNNSINKQSKSNISSSLFSPKKMNSSLAEKEKNNIRKIINIINSKSKQKFGSYKSEKFLHRNKKKIILKRDSSNMLLKIKDLKQFREYSSYIKKRSKNSENIKEEKKDNNNKNNICEKKRNVKEFLLKIKNGNENNKSNIEMNKLKKNKISIKKVNIPLINKNNQSEPYISTVVDEIKSIKKYIHIPNKNSSNNNKLVHRENIISNQDNFCQNKDISNIINYSNTNPNSNLLTTNNNNSALSNYNNEMYHINQSLKKYNNFKITIFKAIINTSNSSSKKKVEHKKKILFPNEIKYTNKINNNIDDKNGKIVQRNICNNKYNTNNILYNRDNNDETSYFLQ